MTRYVKNGFTTRPVGGDYLPQDPDTLAEDFYHNKQNRASKRQQKWLKKRDHNDYNPEYDN